MGVKEKYIIMPNAFNFDMYINKTFSYQGFRYAKHIQSLSNVQSFLVTEEKKKKIVKICDLWEPNSNHTLI